MSLEAITEINLDVNQPGLEVVHAKQYDTARKVKAHLFYNGVKWEVPTGGVTAVVSYKKADKIGGFYDQVEGATGNEYAVAVDSNDRSIVTISLDRATMTTVSSSQYPEFVEVTFYGGSSSLISERLSTFSFKLIVEASSITELDLVSSAQFNVLDQKMNQVINAADNLTSMTADAEGLAPDASPTAEVTGGSGAGDPYNIHLGIPKFPGLNQPTATKVKPGGSPTAEVTGGGSASQKYTFSFGIPSFTGITASATGLLANENPTVTVTGGTTGTEPYNLAFGIPKGSKPIAETPTYSYQNSSIATSIPSGSWTSSPSPEKGKYTWCRAVTPWDSGGTTTTYAVAYQGVDGTGAVHSVNSEVGNVILTASDINTSTNDSIQAVLNADGDAIDALDARIDDVEDDLSNHDLIVTISTLDSLPKVVTNSLITANHVLAEAIFSEPTVQENDWTIETQEGLLRITGTIKSNYSTSLTLLLTNAKVITG